MALVPVEMTGSGKDNIKEGFTAVNQIITDLASASANKGASCVGVRDAAGNLAATNVEDAITEIYSDHSAAVSMTQLFDENSATTTGLTWGYKGGSFRNDNVITTIAAGTVSLTNNTTNYVEVGVDGVVYVVASDFTSSRMPIRTVVTVGGAQTTSTDKRAWFYAWPTAGSTSGRVDGLKVTVNTTVNILDLIEKTTGLDPAALYPIRVSIPDGTGFSYRSRTASVLSGTGSFTLANGTGYWGLPSLDGSMYEVYVYAIWSTADSGLVWGLCNRSDLQLCPAGTTNTVSGYMLLENSSTYTRAGTDYCIAVARVRLTYDTADTPDYTFSTANISIIHGPYVNNIATFTNTAAGGAMEYVLPVAYVGAKVKAIVTAAQYLRLTAAASTTISFLGTASAAAGYVRANTVGYFIELEATSTTTWVVTNMGGAWTYDE
jgi:hypothetical protein